MKVRDQEGKIQRQGYHVACIMYHVPRRQVVCRSITTLMSTSSVHNTYIPLIQGIYLLYLNLRTSKLRRDETRRGADEPRNWGGDGGKLN